MKTELNKLEGNFIELKVEFDAEEWKKAQDKTLRKVAKNMNIPGFRKGKAPVSMVKSMVNKAMLLEDSLDVLMNQHYTQLLRDNKISPIAQPQLTMDVMTEDELKVTLKIEVKPEITLGEYKGIEVVKDVVEVTEEDVENEIKALQEQNAELQIKEEGEVEEGDTAVIDFEGFVDGVAFEGGKGEKHPLVIGSHSFIPGFEDQVKGMKVNEEKDVVVTFPEDYQATDLASKEATFKVVCHEIKTRVLPEVNDEFVKDCALDGVETVEDLRTNIKTRLQNQKEQEAENKYTDELYSKVIEQSPFDVPETMINNEIDQMISEIKQNIQQQGIDFDTFTKITGKDETSIREEVKAQAEQRVRFNLILEAIAKAENLTVTEEEIDEEFNKIAEAYGKEVKEIKSLLSGVTDSISNDLLMRKAVKVIRDNAK